MYYDEQVDKQEGVYAGGKAEYTGQRSYEVYGDFQKGTSSRSPFIHDPKYFETQVPLLIMATDERTNKSLVFFVASFAGCLDDIRLESRPLPLPPALNGTQWGQATTSHGVRRNCPSNAPCAAVACPPPFECVDLWMDFDCR